MSDFFFAKIMKFKEGWKFFTWNFGLEFLYFFTEMAMEIWIMMMCKMGEHKRKKMNYEKSKFTKNPTFGIKTFGQKSEYLPKIWIFVENPNICQKSEYLSKIRIFFRNLNICQKSEYLSKIEYLIKKLNFIQKLENWNFDQKFGQKFTEKYEIMKIMYFFCKISQKRRPLPMSSWQAIEWIYFFYLAHTDTSTFIRTRPTPA